MNSVSSVSVSRIPRSKIENATQKRPKRSLISRVADAGDGAQSRDHLLVDQQHRQQQEHDPQHAVAVVLARLGVGLNAAGVVVADHYDQARAHDREIGQELAPAADPRCTVVHRDPAKPTLDIANVRGVEYRRRKVKLAVGDHGAQVRLCCHLSFLLGSVVRPRRSTALLESACEQGRLARRCARGSLTSGLIWVAHRVPFVGCIR